MKKAVRLTRICSLSCKAPSHGDEDGGTPAALNRAHNELAQTYYREFVAQKIASNQRLRDRAIRDLSASLGVSTRIMPLRA
jgi:hypothetical protein